MSTTRKAPGGWVNPKELGKGPNGRSLCRKCSNEVPPGRRTFCSKGCVHEWRLRTDPGYLREETFKRDHGVCALCRANTAHVKAALRYAAKLFSPKKLNRPFDYFDFERIMRDRVAWQADHILPVIEGGGECGLENIRTLCLKCHKSETAALARRRAMTA